jgi:hypothetical protein
VVRRKSSERKLVIGVSGTKQIKPTMAKEVYEVLERYLAALDECESSRVILLTSDNDNISTYVDSYANSAGIPHLRVQVIDKAKYGRGSTYLSSQVVALADRLIAFRTPERTKGIDHLLELAASRRRKLTRVYLKP